MSSPPFSSKPESQAQRNARGLESGRRKGPEFWTYVGGGSDICPAWQNSFDHAGDPYDPVGFRLDAYGNLEWKGVVDVSGASPPDVAFTLPAEYTPSKDRVYPAYVFDGADVKLGRYVVDSSTGDVTVEVEAIAATATVSVPVDLRNPTKSAGFLPIVFAGVTVGTWFYIKDVEARIAGLVNIPTSFSEVAIKLAFRSAVDSTSGDVRFEVATLALGSGDDPDGALTSEAAQTIAVDDNITIARFPTSGGLSSSPAAGDILIVDLFHDGDHAADTLAENLLLLSAWLEVT